MIQTLVRIGDHQCSPGHVCCSVTVFYSVSHPQDLIADCNCSCASGFTGRNCAEEEEDGKGEVTAPFNDVKSGEEEEGIGPGRKTCCKLVS